MTTPLDVTTSEIVETAQDSIERLVFAVNLLGVAGDLSDDLTDSMVERLKVISGAVNVLASRIE